MKILLWGAGDRTKKFIERDFFAGNEIVAIIDTYYVGKKYLGYPVIRPNQILKYTDVIDYIVVCNQFYIEITSLIRDLGISLDKVMITDYSLDEGFRQCYERTSMFFPILYEKTKNSLQKSVKLNERDFADSETIFKNDRFRNTEYYLDYFRYRTFEFIAEEIKMAGICGAIAELGVFRGTFSALLNEKFLDRTLYLFDTFEGFDSGEAKQEMEKGRCEESFIASHKDTSVELMLKNLPYPQKTVVCKGFFPDSVNDIARKETFALVSLDVDFEESTYQGLKFFYPRMTTGGYVLVHDYNTYFLDGVKKAVKRYEQELGICLKKVPLADRAGTLVIIK